MLYEGLAGDIETREQPATPRTLLVGHWLALRLHFVVEHVNVGLQTPDNALTIIVKLRQGSGKDRQGMAVKAKGLKA